MPIYFNLLCLIDMKLLAGGKLKLKENLFNLLLTDCPIPSIYSFFFTISSMDRSLLSSDFSDEAEKRKKNEKNSAEKIAKDLEA